MKRNHSASLIADTTSETAHAGENGLSKEDGGILASCERHRITSVVYLIGFLDLLGVSMILPLLPKLTYNLGASRSVSGLIGSLYGAIQIFSSPAMGKMSDQYGRRSLLLLSYLGSSFGYFCLSSSKSIPMVILSRIPSGLFKHGLSISKAYLADITKPEDRPSIYGYFNSISSIGFIIGPLITGYLADLDPSFNLSILAGVTVHVTNFFCVFLLLPAVEKDLVKSKNTLNWRRILDFFKQKEIFHSLNIFKGFHWKGMIDVIVIAFLGRFSILMFRANLPIFLDEHISVSNATLGKIISFNGIFAVVASAICGFMTKYYSNHSRQIVHFSALLFFSLISLALSSSIPQILLFSVFLCISTSNLRICTLSLLLQRGREGERGAIIGFSNSLSSIARMLAPSVVGVAQEFGSRVCGFVAALLALLAFVGTLLYLGRGQKMRNE